MAEMHAAISVRAPLLRRAGPIFHRRRTFIVGCHDAALDFIANIGKWWRKRAVPRRFDGF
jgi:hypothetical protein